MMARPGQPLEVLLTDDVVSPPVLSTPPQEIADMPRAVFGQIDLDDVIGPPLKDAHTGMKAADFLLVIILMPRRLRRP